MKLSHQNIFLVFFWLLVAVDLYSLWSGNSAIHRWVKPLLMPMLLLVVLWHPGSKKRKAFVVAALIFSFIGDVLLLFESSNALFFILGLLSFLLAHVCYILFFNGLRRQAGLLFRKWWIAVLAASYGFMLLWILYPNLGGLAPYVTVYAIVLTWMLLAAINVSNSLPSNAAILLSMGAVCFVISDSLLALNKFYTAFPYAPLLIMGTYCVAQFLIVRGYSKLPVTNKQLSPAVE